MKKINYKKSGVNIKRAEQIVKWIKQKHPAPFQFLGSDYASFWPFPLSQYKNPVLVASTDGVGTKLKLASYFKQFEGIGQDLVAMCVNDLICTGAKPLFFLDYYACGKLSGFQVKSFLKGVKKACKKACCPLVGGEMAELPGLYKGLDFDCAGFCVGVVERSRILKAPRVKLGDNIVALKSSGFHSNGYSLLRKIYKSPASLKKHKESLMNPTRLYTFLSRKKIAGLKAMAHITGGGLDNLSRILPKGLRAGLKPWPVPPCFLNVRQKAGISWMELLKTLNCGLGMVLIVKNKEVLNKIFPRESFIDLGQVEKVAKASKRSWNLDFKAMEKYNV